MFSVLVIIKIGPTVFWTTYPFTQLQKSCALYSYWTSRWYANSQIVNSQTGHLVYWSIHALVSLQTQQVAD